MEIGDLVEATWPDGLVCTGTYMGSRRGYVILIDENNQQIVCNKHTVEFKTLKEKK